MEHLKAILICFQAESQQEGQYLPSPMETLLLTLFNGKQLEVENF